MGRTAAQVAMQHIAGVQEGHALGNLRGQRQHQRQVGRAVAPVGIRTQQAALYRGLWRAREQPVVSLGS